MTLLVVTLLITVTSLVQEISQLLRLQQVLPAVQVLLVVAVAALVLAAELLLGQVVLTVKLHGPPLTLANPQVLLFRIVRVGSPKLALWLQKQSGVLG